MSEEQKVNIKQRIIGAMVLVSLAIIIIPVLLNGGATPNQSISGDNIPKMPVELNRILPNVPEPMEMPSAKVVRAYPESSDSASKAVKKPIAPTSKKVVSKPKEVDNSKSSNVAVQPKPKVATVPKHEKQSKPATSKIKMAYTLQIASFGKKSNADALKIKLQKKKYKAYIESVLTSNGRIYRLRVGPYLKFDQISTIKNKIEKQFKLKNTVIIKY